MKNSERTASRVFALCATLLLASPAFSITLKSESKSAVTPTLVPKPTLTPPADLVIDSFRARQLKVNVSTLAVNFGVAIKNAGSTPSGAFTVGIDAEPSVMDAQKSMCPGWYSAQTGVQPKRVQVVNLAPSQTLFIDFLKNQSSVVPLRQGQCTYTVYVDTMNTVKESNEANNKQSVSVSTVAQ